jgi:hypothetical protein
MHGVVKTYNAGVVTRRIGSRVAGEFRVMSL